MRLKKIVIIILYDSEKRFLLQHRSKDTKLLPGYWAFFGGEIEQGETPEDAVRREGYEELNLQSKTPQLIIEEDFKEGNINVHMYVYLEAFEGDKSTLKLQEGQGWGWYKESEMCSLKMIERDRQMIRFVVDYLENAAIINCDHTRKN